MVGNANSVNIKSSAAIRAAYHHGDLRHALVRAGVDALDSGTGAEDISLRALARAVGVSATAVYRHFPDRASLLAALAIAGLDRLAEAQAMAAGREIEPKAAFAATGAAYVRFAMAHPALFRLIWSSAPERDLLSIPVDASHPALTGLMRGIAAVLPDGADDDERRAAAISCWGLVHGMAMLALDRQIVLDDATIDRVVHGHARRAVGDQP